MHQHQAGQDQAGEGADGPPSRSGERRVPRCPTSPELDRAAARRGRRAPALLVLLPLAACSALAPDEDPVQRVRGPLDNRPQHPLLLTVMGPRPRRAATVAPGDLALAVDASWASIHEVGSDAQDAVTFDGEIGRLAARGRVGVGDDTDLELELAAIYASAGFLDSFVNDFHEFFGFPQGGRDERDENLYDMEVQRMGVPVWEVEGDRLMLADTPVTVTHRLRREDEGGPAVALRAGVEVPTGDSDRGSGNDGLDVGLGFLLERSLGRYTWFGGLDYVYPAQVDSLDAVGIRISELWQAQGGLEVRWTDRLSLLGHLTYVSPMTDSIDLDEIDKPVTALALGFVYDVGPSWQLLGSFREDLVALSGVDFSAYLSLRWGF